MPTFVYKCNDCSTKYDVFHKTNQEEGDIKCPNCNSVNSKKLIAAANFGGFSSAKSYDSAPASSCSSGTCGCNFN